MFGFKNSNLRFSQRNAPLNVAVEAFKKQHSFSFQLYASVFILTKASVRGIQRIIAPTRLTVRFPVHLCDFKKAGLFDFKAIKQTIYYLQFKSKQSK